MEKQTQEIAGLRFQIYSREVHVHDDKKNIKYVCSRKEFKDRISEALRELKEKDAGVVIPGKEGVALYLLKNQGDFVPMISDGGDFDSEINSFVRGL